MFKLHHLRDFVAIAHAQTLRGAARNLGLAQPTLTRSLRELEEDLGVALVDRHARGVHLTDAGHRFLDRASSVLEELRRAREESAQVVGEFTGSVMVGMSVGAVLALLPVAFPQFVRECPRVHLRIYEGMFPMMEPRLRNGQIDFYVGPGPERALDRAYHGELLFRNRRQVIGRKGHPLARAKSLKDLLSADWMLTTLRERAIEEFQEQFAVHGLPPPASVTQTDSGVTALVLLSSSDLLSFLPHQWAMSPQSRDLLQAIPVREALAGPDIVMISRAGLPLTPAAERFSILLRRAAGQPFKRTA
jgi:DNA-binding transcriptional LysR family regulator